MFRKTTAQKENIQELVDQYLFQKRSGEAPSVEEYVQRHPDYENELLQVLNDFEWIHAAFRRLQHEEQEEEAEELTEEKLGVAWQRFRSKVGLRTVDEDAKVEEKLRQHKQQGVAENLWFRILTSRKLLYATPIVAFILVVGICLLPLRHSLNIEMQIETSIRSAGAEVLLEMKKKRYVESFNQVLKAEKLETPDEDGEDVRQEAAEALGARRAKRAVEPLNQDLKDKDVVSDAFVFDPNRELRREHRKDVKRGEGELVPQSGYRFQISLSTSKEAYVALILYNSAGQVELLAPTPKVPIESPTQEGRRYYIPAETKWFSIDEQSGMETVFVIGSKNPLEPYSIEEIIREIRNIASQIENRSEVVNQTVKKLRKLKFSVVFRSVEQPRYGK